MVSSRPSFPSSRSCMTAVAVNVLVIEPIRNCVSGVAARAASTSASPTAVSETSSPSRTTAATTLGNRLSACSFRTRRSSSTRSVSGADKEPESARNRLDRDVDVRVVDVEVRDRAQHRRKDRRRQQHAGLAQPHQRVLAGKAERLDVHLHEVRLHFVGEGDARVVQRRTEPAGPCVVVGEAVDVVLERVDARRRDDPGLPHRAAEEVLHPPRGDHQLGGPGDDGAERTPETLREAERHGVEAPAVLRGGKPRCDRRVEQPRPIEVDADAELARRRDERVDLVERPDAAARAVVRVLDRDDPRARVVRATRLPERRPHLVWREAAGDRRKAARDEAGVHRRPPELGEQQVRVLLREQLVARPRLDPQRDLVRHRGRRQEDGLLLPEQRGGGVLELEHRRVLALLFVADLRARDRLAHRRRRPRRRVGAQVDHGGSLATDSEPDRHRATSTSPRPGYRSPMDLQRLETWLGEAGEPRFRAGQVWRWTAAGAVGYDQMTDLPLSLRRELAAAVPFSTLTVEREARSRDGTVKALFRTHDGHPVEAVLMRYRDGRRSLCVSSQSGCPLTCTFCATGSMAFGRNLTASEILDQALHFRRKEAVNHAVFMGMGEPMMNLDHVLDACRRLPDLGIAHSKIGVSTVGWIPGIDRMAEEGPPVRLALSLHAADEALRSELMPVNDRYPLRDVLDACLRWHERRRRQVFVEYLMLEGVNDRYEQAVALAGLLEPRRAFKVNLIPYNPTDSGYRGSGRDAIAAFRAALEERGVRATVRLTRGRDIAAACGQLAARR